MKLFSLRNAFFEKKIKKNEGSKKEPSFSSFYILSNFGFILFNLPF